MDNEVIEKVSNIWEKLGLPGNGRPIWKNNSE
jgi:4-hydroxy-3-polyprenylbenzoate decarboxylase